MAAGLHPGSSFPGRTSSVHAIWLGRREYGAAFGLQRRLAALRDAEQVPDLLLFVEHDPVFTLGRRGSRDDIRASEEELSRLGIAVRETNRGGLVTYHGPGQIVGYPIVRLRGIAADAPGYVYGLEETIIRTLASWGVRGWRHPSHRGVFTDGGKVAAIGVAVTHGVTTHGFALNLQADLRHFSLIDPCGIGDLGVTSVERLTGRGVDLEDAGRALAFHFGRVFGRLVESAVPAALEGQIGTFQVQSL